MGVFGLFVIAARTVARLLLSLGMTVNFVDSDGNTALDYAVLHERFHMVRFFASMGAELNSASPWWTQAMNAVLKEVQAHRENRKENRKRKREEHSAEACPDGQRRAANVCWTYSDTEPAEPTILRKDATVIHDNTDFFRLHTFREDLEKGSQEDSPLSTSSAGKVII